MSLKNILLTGPPQSGKTTLVKKIIQTIDRPLVGFWTEEIREKGHRVGFELHSLHGQKDVFAHVDYTSKFQVGKYGVDIARFEAIALPAMQPEHSDHVVIIDEIGKMECFSESFCDQLLDTLNSSQMVIATIAQFGSPFIGEVKERCDVEVIAVTLNHQDALLQEIITKT
jgi:nucleoside-triphosphatase